MQEAPVLPPPLIAPPLPPPPLPPPPLPPPPPLRSLPPSESFDSCTANDRTSLLLRELLMSERTASRELGLLVKLRDVLHGKGCKPIDDSLGIFVDLHNGARETLKEMEESLSPSNGVGGVAELLLRIIHNSLPLYTRLVDHLPIFLSALSQCLVSLPSFSSLLRAFVSSEDVYLSVHWLLCRSFSRPLLFPPVIASLIESLLVDGTNNDTALTAARVCLDKVSSFVSSTARARASLVSFVTLLQVDGDLGLAGVLSHPLRRLIRVGRVERLTRRGLVSRLLLLFTDCLVIGSRSHEEGDSSPFRVNLSLPLKGLLFDEGEGAGRTGRAEESISLYHHDTSLVFASSAKEEWLGDIREAVKVAVRSKAELPPVNIPRAKENEEEGGKERREEERAEETELSLPRRMSPIEICWYRMTSLEHEDWNKMVSSLRSGYLLRKLRNSTGWQKLWVVVANFSLFFFKSHHDSIPLANLPLLEYSVCIPTLQDKIPEENVFKLVYSTHTYFFRAETQLSRLRWMECIRGATASRRPLDAITALALHL